MTQRNPDWKDRAIRWAGSILIIMGWAVGSALMGITSPASVVLGGAVGILVWWLLDPFYQRKDRIL